MKPDDTGVAGPAAQPGLSGRHAAFARFVALGNAPSQAAVLAGYGARSASRQGWRLMVQPEIAARVDALRASAEAMRRAPVEQVRGELNARFNAAIAGKNLKEAMRLATVCEDLFLRGALKPLVPARHGMDKNVDESLEKRGHGAAWRANASGRGATGNGAPE